jgi:serine/threonine-protein kinase
MVGAPNADMPGVEMAQRWCDLKGHGWSLLGGLGEGGTAPVFEVASPRGLRALKLYSATFSTGEKGKIEQKRIDQQVALGEHDCPSLVQVYEGGAFEDRLYLLMSRAPGRELEKRLCDVPPERIRHIVDQVARAALFLASRDICHRDIKASNVFVSDDFEQVTLLDVSVIRDIHDPVGVGTDQEGQLPVVATARYSPPEYLFRLLEPGPDLWHALTVYQLGGLLHDLIMKEPLFQVEYSKSAQNRYRFAWVVATVTPVIKADDVDEDLVSTAIRALDKDWQRRSALALEDFLADSGVQRDHALRLLGLTGRQTTDRRHASVAARLDRLRVVARALEQAVLDLLGERGVTARHFANRGADDNSWLLRFQWPAADEEVSGGTDPVVLELELKLVPQAGGQFFTLSARLSAHIGEGPRGAALDLPPVADNGDAEVTLADRVESAIGDLGVQLIREQAAR